MPGRRPGGARQGQASPVQQAGGDELGADGRFGTTNLHAEENGPQRFGGREQDVRRVGEDAAGGPSRRGRHAAHHYAVQRSNVVLPISAVRLHSIVTRSGCWANLLGFETLRDWSLNVPSSDFVPAPAPADASAGPPVAPQTSLVLRSGPTVTFAPLAVRPTRLPCLTSRPPPTWLCRGLSPARGTS